tara:strand:- start:1989 stop:2957 length:969 start_codon:yes stop_codon:yes gene_type:complete
MVDMKAVKSRVDMLNMFPKGSVGLEIGTYRGTYAKYIADIVEPKMLHLVDPWEHQDSDKWEDNKRNYDQNKFNGIFGDVQKIFTDYDNVTIHRLYSDEAVYEFDDEYFDWIYIDGCHMYECVKADMTAYFPKVKKGGLIAGHDLMVNNKFGTSVIRAFNELVATGLVELSYITLDKSPSYALTKTSTDKLVYPCKMKRFDRKRIPSLFRGGPHVLCVSLERSQLNKIKKMCKPIATNDIEKAHGKFNIVYIGDVRDRVIDQFDNLCECLAHGGRVIVNQYGVSKSLQANSIFLVTRLLQTGLFLPTFVTSDFGPAIILEKKT